MIYSAVIDPLLKTSHARAASLVGEGKNVLDVACGTGALSMMIAKKQGNNVSGVDLDPGMIKVAERRKKKSGVVNATFLVMDAIDLSQFSEKEFDVAVISLALHQFTPAVGLKVLQEMKRVSQRIIIVDYAHPIHAKIYRWFIWLIEWFAGGDHYRNFRQYKNNGGMDTLLDESGIFVKERYFKAKGTLVVGLCEY